MNVNPKTKVSFFSRRHAHLAGKTLLSTPGKGILAGATVYMLWLPGTLTCILRMLPWSLSAFLFDM